MKKAFVLIAVAAVTSAVVSVTALGRDATHGRQAAQVKILSELWLELVGQFQNSPTLTTHIHYGYLSYVQGVAAYKAGPPSEQTALFTFYADGTTAPLIVDGPLRSATRVGTLTIYRDPSTNSDFANPDTFRDGTPVLVAHYRHQPIVSTLTGAVTLLSHDRIISTKPFDTIRGKVQLGRGGDTFEENYTGQNNMPGPPSGYFIGNAVTR